MLLSACVGLPSAVRNVPVADITYPQASRDLNQYKDTSVRWGGVIIDVDNEENFTLVQVLSYPLNYYGRPQLSKSAEGRFVIKSSEFLDPAVYAKDREITVAGKLEGNIQRMIGKRPCCCHCWLLKLFIYGRFIKMILMAMVIEAWVVMVLIPISDMGIMAAHFIGADTIDHTGKIWV